MKTVWGNMAHRKTPQGFIHLLLQLVIIATIVTNQQVNCDDAYDTSNRVLPVDAEHQHKISKPLDAVCTQTIRDNLVKFLKRFPNPPRPNRKPRQDDDGDDGDEDGIAGIIGNLQEGNGALSTLQMLPSVLPQIVSTFSQLSGAVNQGLNGTDTPNIPSFLAKQGMEAIKFFQALAAGASGGGAASAPSRLPPETHHVQRIPGLDPIPMRKPRPGQVSEPYPGTVPGGVGPLQGNRLPQQQQQQHQQPQYPGLDIDDYTDEDIKQYLQPTLPPIVRPGGSQGGGHQWGNFQNQEANYNNRFQQQSNDPSASSGGDPNEKKTSLWQIYKTFRQRPGELGGLTDFQLAHPEAFSNELLQSISQAISSIRGQMVAMGQQGQGAASGGTLSIPTEKAPTEILKEIFKPSVEPTTESPPPPQPQPQQVAPPSPQNTLASIFGGLKRPTLSVYKPTGSISGVAVDLTNLASNAHQTGITEAPPKKIVEEVPASGEDEPTTHEPQGEVAAPPPPSGVELGRPLTPGGTFIGTGTLDSLKAQQNTAKLVNALGPTRPTTTVSPLFHLPGDSQSHLHETAQSIQQVGPQLPANDRNNGFNNKAPYTPVLNGILLEAPRLTPAPPSLYQKRPSDLYLNPEVAQTQAQGSYGSAPVQKPEFAFQIQNKERLPSNFHGPDPTTRRSPALVAAIPSKFEYEQQQLQVQAGDGVAPQNLFAKPTDAVPESDVESSYVPPPSQPQQQNQNQYAPSPQVQESQLAPSTTPTPQFTPQQLQAQQLLKQLIILQRVLQRQQAMKLQQQLELQNAATEGTTSPPPTTTTIPPPLPPSPPQPQLPQQQPSAPVLTKQVSSSIANGFVDALANNNFPAGSTLLVPTKLNTGNAHNSVPPLPPPQQHQNQPFGQQQQQNFPQNQLQNQPFQPQQQNQFVPQQQNQPLYQQQQHNKPFQPQQQNQPLIQQQQQNQPQSQQLNVLPQQQQNQAFQPQQNQPIPQQQQNPPQQHRNQNQPFQPQQQNEPIPQQSQLVPQQQQNQPLPQQEQEQEQSTPPPFPPQNSSPPQPPQNPPPFSNLIASSPQFGGNLLQAPSFAKPTTPPPPATTSKPSQQLSILNGSATPFDAIPFQQFPEFSNNGPSSYFPQASSAVEASSSVDSTSSTNAEPDSDIPAPESTASPSTPPQPSSNPPPSLGANPETTPTPITGSFAPFEPLANFPLQITDSKPYQPPSASAPSPPTTTTPIPSTSPRALPLTSITSAQFPPIPSFSFAHSSGPLFPGGLPASSPGASAPAASSNPSVIIPALPPPPPPRPNIQRPLNSQDPYQHLIRPQFQKPAQNGGYPQFVPSTPILVTSSGLVSPPSQSSPPSPQPSPPQAVNTIISQLISQETTLPSLQFAFQTSTPIPVAQSTSSSVPPTNVTTPSPFSGLASLFSQKIKQTSALSEMAKLPYYQEDSFLPSANKHIPTTPSPKTTAPPNYEDYDEQPPAPETSPKPFDELFSSSSALALQSETTTHPSAPPSNPPSLSNSSVPNYTGAEENDSAEQQPYPNFEPGKPIYWMNMFYPNGVPVLTKVTEPTLPQSTSPPKRRRRTKATTTQQTTPFTITTEPEVEYYDVEEEDENGQMVKKAKKRLKAAASKNNSGTTTTSTPSS